MNAQFNIDLSNQGLV